MSAAQISARYPDARDRQALAVVAQAARTACQAAPVRASARLLQAALADLRGGQR